MIAPMVLVPELKPGDIVVMDNLSSHKRASVLAMIENAGESTVSGLRGLIGSLFDIFLPDECANGATTQTDQNLH